MSRLCKIRVETLKICKIWTTYKMRMAWLINVGSMVAPSWILPQTGGKTLKNMDFWSKLAEYWPRIIMAAIRSNFKKIKIMIFYLHCGDI